MHDRALTALIEALAATAGQPALWIIDADTEPTAIATARVNPATTTVLTNRFEQAAAARARGFDTRFSDYDFDQLPGDAPTVIGYRIGKDKALVHHVITRAGHCLAPGGMLALAGCKNEGFATYRKKAAAWLNGAGEVRHLGSGCSIATLTCGESLGEPPEDRHYCDYITVVDNDGHAFASKPGVFGFDRVDRGSALLLEVFRERLTHWLARPRSVLDLGCGFGLLAINAALACDAEVVATDHNLAAVTACRRNFEQFHLRGRVVVDDCAAAIDECFDTVLCNPPFHRGFRVAGDLTARFIAAAAAHLTRNGRALFVVNEFIALERAAVTYFAQIQLRRHESGFKVFELSGRL